MQIYKNLHKMQNKKEQKSLLMQIKWISDQRIGRQDALDEFFWFWWAGSWFDTQTWVIKVILLRAICLGIYGRAQGVISCRSIQLLPWISVETFTLQHYTITLQLINLTTPSQHCLLFAWMAADYLSAEFYIRTETQQNNFTQDEKYHRMTPCYDISYYLLH